MARADQGERITITQPGGGGVPEHYRWPEGGPRRGTCRSCGATIWWAQHERTGKMSPMNHQPPPETAPTITHFATCPNAQRHRKGQAGA